MKEIEYNKKLESLLSKLASTHRMSTDRKKIAEQIVQLYLDNQNK